VVTSLHAKLWAVISNPTRVNGGSLYVNYKNIAKICVYYYIFAFVQNNLCSACRRGKLRFLCFSSEKDDSLPSIAYNATESRHILWGKTKLGFQVRYRFHKMQILNLKSV
jgi:hypothetical protein